MTTGSCFTGQQPNFELWFAFSLCALVRIMDKFSQMLKPDAPYSDTSTITHTHVQKSWSQHKISVIHRLAAGDPLGEKRERGDRVGELDAWASLGWYPEQLVSAPARADSCSQTGVWAIRQIYRLSTPSASEGQDTIWQVSMTRGCVIWWSKMFTFFYVNYPVGLVDVCQAQLHRWTKLLNLGEIWKKLY